MGFERRRKTKEPKIFQKVWESEKKCTQAEYIICKGKKKEGEGKPCAKSYSPDSSIFKQLYVVYVVGGKSTKKYLLHFGRKEN